MFLKRSVRLSHAFAFTNWCPACALATWLKISSSETPAVQLAVISRRNGAPDGRNGSHEIG